MLKNVKIHYNLVEYTYTWEQREFKKDLLKIQTGTNKLGSETPTNYPLIKMGNLQRGSFSFSKLEYLSEKAEDINIINKGDFLFNTRNTLELVGKGATWFGISGKYAFNSNIARFTLNGIDTTFFNYLYNTNNFLNKVHARAVGTTSVAAIYPKSLESITYRLPCTKEQQLIGKLFFSIDQTITLLQRE